MEKVRLLILVLAVPALINGQNDDVKQMNENVAENVQTEVDPRWRMQLFNRFQEVQQVNWPRRQQNAVFGERPSLIEIPHNWHHNQQQQNLNQKEFREPFNNIEVLNHFNEIHQSNDFKHHSEMKPEIPQPLKGISTSILVPLVPVHVDPMGNTVRLPVTFQRQERQSNLVNDRAIVHPHMRFHKPHHAENDNHFEEQRNVENQHQNPGKLQQVQVPVFVPQNQNKKLEENFIDKMPQFRPPLNTIPQQDNKRFPNRPNEHNENVNFNDDNAKIQNFRQAKEQSANNVPLENMLTNPQQTQTDSKAPNRQRPFLDEMSRQNQKRPDNDRSRDLLKHLSVDLSNVPFIQFPVKNAQKRPPFPLQDQPNGPPFPTRDQPNGPSFPTRDQPNGPPFPTRDQPNGPPFPTRDQPNGPPFPTRDQPNGPPFPPRDQPNGPPFPTRDQPNGPPFPTRDQPNGPPFPTRDQPNGPPFPPRDQPNRDTTNGPPGNTQNGPPFPLQDLPNNSPRDPINSPHVDSRNKPMGPPFLLQDGHISNIFPSRDTLNGPSFLQPGTLNDHPFPLRESENDNSFQFREPPNGQFGRDQMPNHIRQQFEFPNQNPEQMNNQNQLQFPNQNQQQPNQNQQQPNQNQQQPNQNQRQPNQNQQQPNQNHQQPNQDQMPFINPQQQFANNQQPPHLLHQQQQQRRPHQLSFNNQRPPPEMMQNFHNQNRPFFNFNREPNFDGHPNSIRPDFNPPNNFPHFTKDLMPLPEISNGLTSVMPNNNGPRRPPFEFLQGPLRPPFTGAPQNFRSQRPQMPPPKNVEVPKIFGDFPSQPKFDRNPWIPVTPLPKFPRKPIASSSREALRVENPPTNSFSTTLPSVSTVSGVGLHFEQLPPTSTPHQLEEAVFKSTMMTPVSTLISFSTIAPPLVDRSPKIDLISINQTDLISNQTIDEQLNRLRRLPEPAQFDENRPIESSTLSADFTTPTLFNQQSINSLDSTPWTNEPLTDVPIASSLAITESIDYPSTTPSQEMSANLRQISVEQLYRHWKTQFAQTKMGEQEQSTTESFNATSFPQPQSLFNGGIVNERLQALDLRPSDWSRRTSPQPSTPEVTSFQTPQIQTPDTFGREEGQSNSVHGDRRRNTGYVSTSTEPYSQLLKSESVVTPNYVMNENYATTAATTMNNLKKPERFTRKILVRRKKLATKKISKTQDVTVNQIEYSTPPTF